MSTVVSTLLEVRTLSKRFGGYFAVADMDLTVRKHSIHAVIGPNGAGKTTLFNLITGVALLLASVIAGALWEGFGPQATFLAGTVFAAATLAGLLAIRSRLGQQRQT